MKKGLWGKFFDVVLIVALFYAVFVFGKCKGYSDGQIQGYMIGYESYYQKAFEHCSEQLDGLSR